MMDLRIQIIIAALLIVALVIVVNMVRKKKLELRYALAWLGVGVGILILDIFPSLINIIAELMGIADPVNMLFFVGFCFALCIIFGLTSAVSRLSVRVKEMAQEMAILRKTIEDSQEK